MPNPSEEARLVPKLELGNQNAREDRFDGCVPRGKGATDEWLTRIERSVGTAVVLRPLAEVRQYNCRTNREPAQMTVRAAAITRRTIVNGSRKGGGVARLFPSGGGPNWSAWSLRRAGVSPALNRSLRPACCSQPRCTHRKPPDYKLPGSFASTLRVPCLVSDNRLQTIHSKRPTSRTQRGPFGPNQPPPRSGASRHWVVSWDCVAGGAAGWTDHTWSVKALLEAMVATQSYELTIRERTDPSSRVRDRCATKALIVTLPNASSFTG